MARVVRGLVGPIAVLVGIGATHLLAELARPELQTAFTPGALLPIYLVVGAWAGAAMVRAGATVAVGVLAGVAIGLMPVALQYIGFGIILGRDGAAVATSAAVGFLGLVWGAVFGSGLAWSWFKPNEIALAARR